MPDVEWKTGDGKDLPSDGRFSVYGRELNVINVTRDDTGRYVCKARNVMGEISHGSNLKVLGECYLFVCMYMSVCALFYTAHL